MNDCLFCKILQGEVPSIKIYEDDAVYAFLDIRPVNQGHTLVIPKKHVENLYAMDDGTLCSVMRAVRTIATSTKEALGADGINLEMNNDPIAGQVIFHAHIHVVPRFEGDGLHHWPGKEYEEEDAKGVQQKITAQLEDDLQKKEG